MQTGTSIPSPRRRRTTLTPSSPGIITSRTMTEGGRCATAASASCPSAAVDTAKPSSRSARSRACLTVASSSTTRTSGSLRTTPPMMRLRPDGVLDLRLGDAELARELRDERVALGVLLLLEHGPDRLECGAQLCRADPQLLGERGAGGAEGGPAVVAGTRPRPPGPGAPGPRSGPHRVERGTQLGLGDADLLG